MYNFDKLIPCDKPFILDQDNAVAYLKHQAGLLFEEATADEHNGYGVGIACDTASKVFEEYIAMAQQILDENWQYVMFTGNDMKDSGVEIIEAFTMHDIDVKDTVKFAKDTLKKMETLNNLIADTIREYPSRKEYMSDELDLISDSCDVIEQLLDIVKTTTGE